MIHPSVAVKRAAIFLHRWMGVALSAIFLMWFVSGIVMMYWSFPEVRAQDRLQRWPVLRAEAVKVTPAEAFQVLQRDAPPSQVLLNSFDGRPVYRFRAGRAENVVFADSGMERTRVSPDVVRRAAKTLAGAQAGGPKEEKGQRPGHMARQG